LGLSGDAPTSPPADAAPAPIAPRIRLHVWDSAIAQERPDLAIPARSITRPACEGLQRKPLVARIEYRQLERAHPHTPIAYTTPRVRALQARVACVVVCEVRRSSCPVFDRATSGLRETSQAGRVMDRAGIAESGRSCAMALARREVLILARLVPGPPSPGGWSARSRCRPKVGRRICWRPRFETFPAPKRTFGSGGAVSRRVQLLGNLVWLRARRDPDAGCRPEVFAAKGAEIVGIGIDQAAKVDEFARLPGSPTPC